MPRTERYTADRTETAADGSRLVLAEGEEQKLHTFAADTLGFLPADGETFTVLFSDDGAFLSARPDPDGTTRRLEKNRKRMQRLFGKKPFSDSWKGSHD